MPVTAKFIPESIELVPGAPTTLTLRLHNNDEAPQVVNLQPSGDLAEFVALDVTTAAIESNQIFDIAVSIEVGADAAAGARQPAVEFTAECGSGTATVAAEVMARSDHSVELSPLRSHGSTAGRHTVRVVNSGNVAVTVELATEPLDEEITLDVEPTFVVTPGATAQVALRVTPATTYWSGPVQEHAFVVRSTSSDGSTGEFAGTYEQRPRVAGWVGPAAAGAGAALADRCDRLVRVPATVGREHGRRRGRRCARTGSGSTAGSRSTSSRRQPPRPRNCPSACRPTSD